MSVEKSTIKSFNSKNIDVVNADIRKALKSVEDKYGITIKVGKVKYSENSYNAEMNVAIGQGLEAYRSAWIDLINLGYGYAYNLKAEDFGTKVELNGKQYTIVGIRPKARTKPLNIIDNEGKIYNCSIDALKHKID